jgi:LysM repeat protein
MSATRAIQASAIQASSSQASAIQAPSIQASSSQASSSQASSIQGFNWEERPVRAARTRQPRLRLTRRGRIVLIGFPAILLSALLISLAGFLNAPAKAADSVSELALTPTVSVTVQPGESLWEIAGAVAPQRDRRDVVADIVQVNNLDGASVMPGQQLFVPSK